MVFINQNQDDLSSTDIPTEATTPELAPETTGLGDPPTEFTDDQLFTITHMAKLGHTHSVIAAALGVTPPELRSRAQNQMDEGSRQANTTVLATLFDLATTGLCPAATMFWAKTRCGHVASGFIPADDLAAADGPPKSKRKSLDQSSPFVSPRVSGLANLVVYNNEGEPNADY